LIVTVSGDDVDEPPDVDGFADGALDVPPFDDGIDMLIDGDVAAVVAADFPPEAGPEVGAGAPAEVGGVVPPLDDDPQAATASRVSPTTPARSALRSFFMLDVRLVP